jgi:hypothetical protein
MGGPDTYTAQAWDDFSNDWDAVLARRPALPWWQMSGARSIENRPPFDVLTPTQKLERELALAEVLRKHVFRGVAVHLSNDYWDKHGKGRIDWSRHQLAEKDKRRGEREYDSPHHVLMHSMYALTRIIVRENKLLDRVDIIVEKDVSSSAHKHSADLKHAVLDIEPWHRFNGGRGVINDIRFTQGKNPEARPLEAADMWAWSVRRYAIEKRREQEIWGILKHVEGKVMDVSDNVDVFIRDMNIP